MKTNSTIVLDAQEISKSYNGIKVLERVSLQIRSTDFYILMGPNGSGKSTSIHFSGDKPV